MIQGDPHTPHWSVLPASIRDAYGHRPSNATNRMGEENEIRDEHEQEYVPADPLFEEDAFAELMEAYYGPSLGHTNEPNEEHETHHESVSPDDDVNAFEADARAPLYEGAQCSRCVNYIPSYCQPDSYHLQKVVMASLYNCNRMNCAIYHLVEVVTLKYHLQKVVKHKLTTLEGGKASALRPSEGGKTTLYRVLLLQL